MILIFSAFVFLVWTAKAVDFICGILIGLPRLERFPESSSQKISIIFSARNEASKVGPALSSMLAQDYPDFEVIAVNDRSEDTTGAILHERARDPRLKIIDIEKLPEKWVGKNYALWTGYRASSGDWLLFTDADIHFHPETLKSAIHFAEAGKLDHLTLFPDLIVKGWIETIFVNYFVQSFCRFFRPWAAVNAHSKASIGIGGFNLVRRSAYEAVGTHERLALEVIDDMELGRALKRAGFHQRAVFGDKFLSVRWVEGFRGVMNALHKNAFAGLEYRWYLLVAAIAAALAFDIAPFVLIFLAKGQAFHLSLGAILWIAACYGAGQKYNRSSLAVFPAHPVAGLFFIFVVARSAWAVFREGGVRWRDTFYPLEILRKTS